MAPFTFLVNILSVVSIYDFINAQQDYCSKFGQSHTMCKYSANSGCKKTNRGTDSSAIQDILSSHNGLRAKVANGQQSGQPGAANMREFIWDAELATIAQRWADQCHFGHDQSHNSFKFPDWVGQNVASTSSSSSDSAPDFGGSAIKMWFDEVNDFNPQNIDPFRFSGSTGHYTQVVWAESYAVGCGYAFYNNQKFYVCNYGPGGNFGDGPVYRKGQACSACANGCSNNYPGLCSTSSSTRENSDTNSTEANHS